MWKDKTLYLSVFGCHYYVCDTWVGQNRWFEIKVSVNTNIIGIPIGKCF